MPTDADYLDKLPEGIRVYPGYLTGSAVASCDRCAYVCAYWEYACELVHDCEGI